jgi:2-keto-3-deoxy-L-rhamnonate aldolase RhmA
MTDRPHPRAFRERLIAREPLIGTFMKTPSSHNVEIISQLGYDFVMLDEEHAPWTRSTLDMGILAARAFGSAAMVRIARPDANSILSILDDGAIGTMMPHCYNAEKARNLVSWSKYKGGSRGAGVGRGGDYSTPMPDHIAFQDKTSVTMAMIEDREAVDNIEEITSVEGLDCIFIGRGDLGLSLSNAPGKAPTVKEATETVAKVALKNGKALSAVTQDMKSDEAKWLMDIGVTAMMVASDLGFLRQAAGAQLKEFNERMKKKN